MRRHPAIVVGLALVLLAAGCVGSATTNAASAGTSTPESDAGDPSTIHVSGSGSAEAAPNRAVVDLAVVATAPDAATARQRLAENVTRMREALERAGIDADQVRTTNYDIGRDHRRPREEGERPRIRYRAAHSLTVTLSDTDRVGTVIDTAVANGATDVRDVEFTLSSDRRRQLEGAARRAAMADARTTARALAESENLAVVGVEVIRTGGGDTPRPVEGGAAATPTATETPPVPSDVEAGPVTVVTTVRVVYRAAPAE
jgi:uncharacterized protein YggE